MKILALLSTVCTLLCATPLLAATPTQSIDTVALRPHAVNVHFGTDIVSSYVCRGSYQSGPSFQPSLTAEYRGLFVNAWGSIDFTGTQMQEVDLALGYRVGRFAVTITDFYVVPLGLDANKQFFRAGDKGPHTFEATLSYTVSRRVPIGLSWGTVFAGADVADDGRRNYSSYAEISYPFKVRRSIDMKTGVGFMPWSTENCFNTYGFAVTNVYLHASRQWTFGGNFRLGVLARLICNPYREQFNFVGGISLYL